MLLEKNLNFKLISKTKKVATSISLYFILFTLAVITLYPLLWIFLMSFKDRFELLSGNSFGLPQKWLFSNYVKAVTAFPLFTYFLNSIFYTAGTIAAILILAGMFAYAVCRMKFRLSKLMYTYIVLGLIIPVEVVIIPIFLLEKRTHLLNTYFSVTLPYIAFNLSLCSLLLYAFFRTIPTEIEESACIDGCSIYRTFFQIIFPISRSAVSTVIIWLYLNIWNEFFIAYIFLIKDTLKTLPLGVLNFISSRAIDWGAMGAAMIISCIPTLIVYLLFSEQVERALTAGALLK
jgi:raffinose/stachyose/melibiose transport system permease protein